MRNVIYIYLFLLTTLLFSCHNNMGRETLEKVDSLLKKEQNDSALSMLSQMNMSELDEDQYMFRNLLLSIAQFKCYVPIPNDSIIKECVHYYTKTKEKDKLAVSYLYHGAIMTTLDKMEEAINSLKQAETIATELNNADLSIKTNVYLSYVNGRTGNQRKSLEYILKALHIAKSINNKRWIGYCFDHIGSVYSSMNIPDSSNYYIEKSIPYTKYLPRIEQPYLINNQAAVFWKKGNLHRAEDYLKMSLSIYPMEQTYGLLAKLFTEQNKLKEADSLWKQVLHTKDIQTKVNTLYPYSEWLYKQGRLKEAWETAMKVPALKDSLAQQQQAEAIMGRQTAYDRQVARMLYQQRIERLTYSVAFMLLFVIIVWMIFYIKSQRTKKQMAENQLLLSNYIQAHEELRKKGKEQSKEVNELNKKIEALRKQQTTILAKGKVRYEEIVNGGNTATWHKADFNDFMEYYRTVNFPFVIHLEQDFKSLPPSNKTILSLYEMGYDDTAVAYIMSMTEGALRTAKSRINKRSRVRA